MMDTAPDAPFVSVFDQVFDLAVLGAGYAGLAATREAEARGWRTLIIEPCGQLLRESTRALETRTTGGEEDAGWRRWIEELTSRGAAGDGYLDPAFAEIDVARTWASSPHLRVLFYARPVAVAADEGTLHAATLATKTGFRTVRARRWVDASENGLLTRLALGTDAPSRREPQRLRHGLTLHSLDWPRHEPALEAFACASGLELLGAVRPTERRLTWDDDGAPWHRQVTTLLRRLREAVPGGRGWIVAQISSEPYALYDAAAQAPDPIPAPNLLVLSPALAGEALGPLGARYAWAAARAREAFPRLVPAEPACDLPPPRPVVKRTLACDVAVAGTGTSGALAALAAGRQGARVVSADFAPFPGGVGTGAGIAGYFHGLEGGLQAETDRLTAAMNRLLEGGDRDAQSWHHEGKKLALIAAFQEHGVTFLPDALLCAVEKTGEDRLAAVLAATGEGLLRLNASTFIDSTGDGDLCALAGAAFASGRRGDRRTLAYSQPAIVLREADGGLQVRTQNFDAGWADPTDPEDLSRARLEGVAQYWKPRWDAPNRPLAVTPLPGIRQSRHITTDYTLSFADLVDHTRFADGVGEAGSILDTHSIDFEFESDEAAFFYWTCRLFRHPLRTVLPYRMMLPAGLANVWVACRAAGIDTTAAYAVRMQRDMQRLGEAAGVAAALASRNGGTSRGVNMAALRGLLEDGANGNGAAGTEEGSHEAERLAAGESGIHLWRLYRDPARWHARVEALLRDGTPQATFYAAAILAMWEDAAAEPRLLAALESREAGPPPSGDNSGAFGQEIDVPFWFQALVLLRRCGTGRALPVLRGLAGDPDTILNVRTALALTIERLAERGVLSAADATVLADPLVRHPLGESLLPLTRSTWRTLRREAQLVLRNDSGVDTRQEHAWQLHLVVCRIRVRAGLAPHEGARAYFADRRAIVRHAFETVAVSS